LKASVEMTGAFFICLAECSLVSSG